MLRNFEPFAGGKLPPRLLTMAGSGADVLAERSNQLEGIQSDIERSASKAAPVAVGRRGASTGRPRFPTATGATTRAHPGNAASTCQLANLGHTVGFQVYTEHRPTTDPGNRTAPLLPTRTGADCSAMRGARTGARHAGRRPLRNAGHRPLRHAGTAVDRPAQCTALLLAVATLRSTDVGLLWEAFAQN